MSSSRTKYSQSLLVRHFFSTPDKHLESSPPKYSNNPLENLTGGKLLQHRKRGNAHYEGGGVTYEFSPPFHPQHTDDPDRKQKEERRRSSRIRNVWHGFGQRSSSSCQNSTGHGSTSSEPRDSLELMNSLQIRINTNQVSMSK
ncbi:hypothetical protein TNIN_239651 [Trichonephila inaurata madagascariensis]|uniref:Uncharacterized protein n=1 Tax=Trichonephila inaurata madagascariensis TaxID=2747483 RepID=A0A8X6XJH7_9ARAC|nr:hypothetical protein TNIN_239651 [Trichonephila inaurata madagascariensis]